jgi:hypothetical protein
MSYSQGVHAYFAGRSAQAERLLTASLSADPYDPRAHYFRGLARLRQGRRDEARADMQFGAALEAQQPNRFAIGAVLERVQGADRLLLEQFRSAGRLAESSRRSEFNRRRYDQMPRSEPERLHLKATLPLDQLMRASDPKSVAVMERSPRPQPAWTGIVARPVASASATGGSDDPFPDDPVQPGPAGAQAGPSAGPVMSPAVPAATTPASADENPFGEAPTRGAAPTSTQPTPGARPTTPPAEDDPFRGL